MSAGIRTALSILLLAAGALGVTISPIGSDASAIELKPDDTAMVAEGRKIYRQHCAACHGLTLKGQANWRKRRTDGKLPAPPHDPTGHTWHHSNAQLFDLTKRGPKALIGPDYQTDMPGYANILTDAQIIAALSYIKSTWPAEIRKKHDAVNQQAEKK